MKIVEYVSLIIICRNVKNGLILVNTTHIFLSIYKIIKTKRTYNNRYIIVFCRKCVKLLN